MGDEVSEGVRERDVNKRIEELTGACSDYRRPYDDVVIATFFCSLSVCVTD